MEAKHNTSQSNGRLSQSAAPSNPSGSDVLTTRPQFTQGELVTHIGQDGGLFIRDKESHRLIAGFQTSTLNERMPEGEGEANAALFMASRDMLAALKAALNPLKSLIPVAPDSMPAALGKAAVAQIDSAIAKAEGR